MSEQSELSGRTAIVVGASRGLGRGIATAVAEAGAAVVAVSRSETDYPAPAGGGSIKPEVANAREATLAPSLIDTYQPDAVIVVAGATPRMEPLQEQDWEAFSAPWQTDVQIAFHWLGEALRKPLRPGSKVIVFSSGAILNAGGSPLSGGYAGAKAMQRFMTGYAQGESKRAGLDITFSAIMPRFAPETSIGSTAVAAYSKLAGMSEEKFLSHQGPLLTPEIAGSAMVELLVADSVAPGYLLTGDGLQKPPS